MKTALTLCLLALAPLSHAAPEEIITVYQLAGTVQCSPNLGVAPEKAADLLRGQGVKVISASRRKLPVRIITRCGAPTGEANVLEVPSADWAVFSAQNADGGGYGIWVFEQPCLEIYKYDGTLQCGLGKEIPVDAMAEELTSAGIEVLASRKGKDGLDHIAVCGASTGAVNIYTISLAALRTAEQFGFDPLVNRELADRIKPQTKPMDSPQRMTPLERPVSPSERTPILW
jgi:hypothetical protein